MYKSKPISCHYNSCLGKTLHIQRNGKLSICPFIENSIHVNELSGCDSIEQVFFTDDYLALLKEQIAKRNDCKDNCLYFLECKGGCPISGNDGCPEQKMKSAISGVTDVNAYIKNPSVYEEKMNSLARSFKV